MHKWLAICLLLLGLFSVAKAASPASFCKCTCFTNSTIIPLNEITQDEPQTVVLSERAPTKAGTCNDCNRHFCLDYNLPICKGATEEDVFTTCFQRDSTKDEAVVFIFIFATVGLLIWAAIRPYIGPMIENMRGRRNYAPVAGEGAG